MDAKQKPGLDITVRFSLGAGVLTLAVADVPVWCDGDGTANADHPSRWDGWQATGGSLGGAELRGAVVGSDEDGRVLFRSGDRLYWFDAGAADLVDLSDL